MLNVQAAQDRIRFDRLLPAAERCFRAGLYAWKIRLSERWHMIPWRTKDDGSRQCGLDVALSKLAKRYTDVVVPNIPTVDEEIHGSHVIAAGRFKTCDPIDGTREFEDGTSVFSTIVVVWLLDGELEACIVGQPAYFRCIATIRGQGTKIYEHGTGLWRDHVGTDSNRASPIGIVGSSKRLVRARHRAHEDLLRRVYRNPVTDIPTVYGGTQVGLGKWALCFTYGTGRIWDYGAPALMTEENGGYVRHLSGKPLSWHAIRMGADEDPIIFAKSELAFEEVQRVLGARKH